MIIDNNKTYWHGTDKESIEKEGSEYPIYLSTSFEHSLSYCRDYITREWHPLYIISLNKNLNIFDAQNREDYNKLYNHLINKGNKPETVEDVLDKLKDRHWLLVKNRDTIIKIIKKLGYDGYFNWEVDEPGLEENPSYCIFNRNYIKVISVLYKNDIIDYINNSDILKAEKEIQKIDYEMGDYGSDEYPPLLSKEEIDEINNK